MTETTGRARLIIAFLWLTGILAAAQFAKVAVAFPIFREIYPGFGPKLGFLVSALSLMGLVFGLFAGMILSRFGFRKLLVGGLILGGAMSLFQASQPEFWPMLISRVIEGASHLLIVVAAPTLIGRVAPASMRNTAMALWSTVFAVAFALMSWLGLPFVTRFGVTALFMLHGSLLWAMALCLIYLLPKGSTVARPRLGLREIIAKHVSAYGSPFIAAPAAGWFFYAMGFVALVTVVPDFMPVDQRVTVSGIMPLAALCVSMTVGVALLRFVSPVTVLISGFLLAAGFALALGLGVAQGPVAVATLGALGLVQAGSFAAIPRLNTEAEAQSLANGALAQTGNAGNLIGTPLLLWLVELWGLAGLIGFATIAFGLAAAVHLWLAGLRRDPAQP